MSNTYVKMTYYWNFMEFINFINTHCKEPVILVCCCIKNTQQLRRLIFPWYETLCFLAGNLMCLRFWLTCHKSNAIKKHLYYFTIATPEKKTGIHTTLMGFFQLILHEADEENDNSHNFSWIHTLSSIYFFSQHLTLHQNFFECLFLQACSNGE